jgi:hypothetical protein
MRLGALMKRNLLLSFLFAAVGIFLLGAKQYYEYREVLLDDYAYHVLDREAEIRSAIGVAKTIFPSGGADVLKAFLEEGRRLRHFDYYIVQEKGEPRVWGTASGSPDAVNHQFKDFDEMVIFEDKSFYVTKLDADHTLMIGINKTVDAYLKISFEGYWQRLIPNLLATFIGLYALIFFARRV